MIKYQILYLTYINTSSFQYSIKLATIPAPDCQTSAVFASLISVLFMELLLSVNPAQNAGARAGVAFF